MKNRGNSLKVFFLENKLFVQINELLRKNPTSMGLFASQKQKQIKIKTKQNEKILWSYQLLLFRYKDGKEI